MPMDDPITLDEVIKLEADHLEEKFPKKLSPQGVWLIAEKLQEKIRNAFYEESQGDEFYHTLDEVRTLLGLLYSAGCAPTEEQQTQYPYQVIAGSMIHGGLPSQTGREQTVSMAILTAAQAKNLTERYAIFARLVSLVGCPLRPTWWLGSWWVPEYLNA